MEVPGVYEAMQKPVGEALPPVPVLPQVTEQEMQDAVKVSAA